MPELPPVSPGEIIASDHINDIAARSVQRYATAGDRSVEDPTPEQGAVSYLSDTSQVDQFNGSAWVPIGTGIFLEIDGDQMNAPLRFSTGSELAPSATFAGDTDTGMYNPGPNQIGLSTGGTKRLQLASSGADFSVPVTSSTGFAIGQRALRSIFYSASDPGGAVDGDMWINSTAKTISVWTGGGWAVVITGV